MKKKEDAFDDIEGAMEKTGMVLYFKDTKVQELVKNGESKPLAVYLKNNYPEEIKKIANQLDVSQEEGASVFAGMMIKFSPDDEERREGGGRGGDYIRDRRQPFQRGR